MQLELSFFLSKLVSFFYILNDKGFILATDDMRLTRPIIFRSISSKDLPWVSGTYSITKNIPMKQITPNNQNAPCPPIDSVE